MFIMTPLFLHAAGLRAPNFQLPKEWPAWVYAYRRVLGSRRLEVSGSKRGMMVFPTKKSAVFLQGQAPSSTFILMGWVRQARLACEQGWNIPSLPPPATAQADDEKRLWLRS